jgi:hypothetical protein
MIATQHGADRVTERAKCAEAPQDAASSTDNPMAASPRVWVRRSSKTPITIRGADSY